MESQSMSDSCCQGHVDVAALHARQRRILIIVLVVNTATFLMMVYFAIFSGSSSLLSAALDNFGDAMTYALSLMVVGASGVAKARVALFKGMLILCAALAVVFQIGWRIMHSEIPIVEAMGIAALLNLGANSLCLWLLTPYRDDDVNMTSAWECSRNDVSEGLAVIATTFAVWVFGSGWPDLVVAVGLLILFLRSAVRVLRRGWQELHPTLSQN